MSSFVKQPDVRQENFDWGVIGWRLTPDSGSKHLVIMDVTLEPSGGHDFHRHPGQEEMIIIKQGRITQYIEQEATTLGPGDSVYLDEGVIHASFNDRQEAFLAFVLAQYVKEGVQELDQDKLSPLLRLRYRNSISDAVADLGDVDLIRNAFVGFQKHLYSSDRADVA